MCLIVADSFSHFRPFYLSSLQYSGDTSRHLLLFLGVDYRLVFDSLHLFKSTVMMCLLVAEFLLLVHCFNFHPAPIFQYIRALCYLYPLKLMVPMRLLGLDHVFAFSLI
jgi:hypothetical protein